MIRKNRSPGFWFALGLVALAVFHVPAHAGATRQLRQVIVFNQPPVITGIPVPTGTVGVAWSFQPAAYDPEGKALKFSIKNKPRWATFDSRTGRLAGTPTAAGTFAKITITASDGRKSASLPAFSITVSRVTLANRAPTISGTPAASVTAGQGYWFQPSAADADGDALSFSITGKPAWAAFNTATGALSGTPTAAHVGTYGPVTVSVSDGKASVALAPFPISVVAPPNNPPTISGTPPTSIVAGQAYAFTPRASDDDGQPLTFAIANKPAWASFNATTGALTGTPTQGGTYSGITISVSDGLATAALGPFAITVAAANRAPTISGTPVSTVAAGESYYFRPSAADADGDALTFSITGKPAWASFSTTTGALVGAPMAADARTYSGIMISVSDGKATTSLSAFAITVTAPVNRAPTISGRAPGSVVAGQAYAFTPSAADADGDDLTFSIANKPAWASFNTSTGALTGTPTDQQVGTYSNIVVSVSDGQASASLAPFAVQVTAANRAPTISGTPATTVTTGQAYSFRPTASDPDGDTLTFTIANKPAWASFDTTNGTLSGTPTTAGTHSGITISVSDGQASSALPAFSIVVPNANRAPTIAGTPPTTATVGQPYAFKATAADADGDVLRFSVANKPAWASFDTDTGTLYGTPAASDVGTHSGIGISVTDGKVSASLAPFSVTVNHGATSSLTLTWSAPTSNVDGSALTNLSGYRVSYGTASRSYSVTVPVSGAGSTTIEIEGLTPGTYYFAIQSVNAVGVASDYSGEVSATI
jgi:hypothetical protein